MCTVSYIPNTSEKKFVLTSNRDEDARRPTTAPMLYDFDNVQLVFPKDEISGGSWIATSNKGKINCLLNGGIGFHQKQDYHTISRGTILIDLTKSELSTRDFFLKKELHNVEPFTIVAIQQQDGKDVDLTEVIWDGSVKHFRNLDTSEPHIWSSAQLYSQEQKELREKWFADFISYNQAILTNDKVIDFHSSSHSEDVGVNVIMQRGDDLKTVSITQVISENHTLKMSYSDLLRDIRVDVELGNN